MDRTYENGPEGMPRVKRMPDAVLNCLIRDSLFCHLTAGLEGEDMDRLYGLMHDTAEEVLARVSAWPVAHERKPVDCSGTPSSCPDNEGYGCYCIDNGLATSGVTRTLYTAQSSATGDDPIGELQAEARQAKLDEFVGSMRKMGATAEASEDARDAALEEAAAICDGLSKLYDNPNVGYDNGYTMAVMRAAKEIRALAAISAMAPQDSTKVERNGNGEG